MMETVLNVDLNDASVKGLAEESGDERFAWDSYPAGVLLDCVLEGLHQGLEGPRRPGRGRWLRPFRSWSYRERRRTPHLASPGRSCRTSAAAAGVPAAPPRTAGPGHQRRVRLLEHRPGAYLDKGVFTVSPFETIDEDGVGRLVQIAAAEGRKTRPRLKLGVCGEHGGDPESIHFFHRTGLDYVSCSPFRVPVARLEPGRAAVS